MKALICIALFFLAAEARHHRNRRDVVEDFKGLLDKFPREEFQAFYDKLREALDSTDAEGLFEKTLQENHGDLDLTVTELKDKLGENYPSVKANLDQAMNKMNSMYAKMNTITLLDVVKAVKGFFQAQAGNVEVPDSATAARRFSEFQTTVMEFFKKAMEYEP